MVKKAKARILPLRLVGFRQ